MQHYLYLFCSEIFFYRPNRTGLRGMEAEYNALSLCMKTVLPFHRTLKKVIKLLKQSNNEPEISFKVSIWEDNIGALTLANLEPGRHTPRSKHYGIKIR